MGSLPQSRFRNGCHSYLLAKMCKSNRGPHPLLGRGGRIGYTVNDIRTKHYPTEP